MIAYMARPHPVQRDGIAASSDDTDILRSLQEKVRRYELIFSATNDVLYDLSLEDATVVWNDALYSQYGYKRTEPAGTLEWWTRHIHPDDAFVLENRVSELFESDLSSWQHGYRFQRADGGYNYVRDRCLLLRDGANKPVRIIGSLLDVTAQTQLDIAKDEFIALVSHQLRTPLTVIRVYGEMLTSGNYGDLTGEQAQWVRNMTNSSVRLIDAVGTILSISRMELGRIKINADPQDIVALTQESVKEVLPLAAEKQVTINVKTTAKLPPVTLDKTIYAQILHNLLTNAIRYTSPQKGKVLVTLKKRTDGLVLNVQDNGVGIPDDAKTHVFERFYRAKNVLGVETQGSGLGLYLVSVLTDAFGGKIWFETKEGEGTTFHLLIPKKGMVSV